jgi:hypothetical protein
VKLLAIGRTIIREGWVETALIGIGERSTPIRAWIPGSIIILSVENFKGGGAIQPLSFELNSQLIRIESSAFSQSSLVSNEIA